MTSFPRFNPRAAAHHPRDEPSEFVNAADDKHPTQDFRNFRNFHGGSRSDTHIDTPGNASETSPCSIYNNNNSSLNVPPFIYVRAREDENSPVCGGPPVKAAKVAKAFGADKTIFEVDLGAVPRDWFEGVRRLISLPCPRGISAARWGRLQMDAAVFLETWGAQASALDWCTVNIFGVNARAPFQRVDIAGLVRLLDGRPVVAMTADEAVILCPTGARQTYRSKGPERGSGQVLLWDLGDGQS